MSGATFPRANVFESRQPGGAYLLQTLSEAPNNVFYVDSNHAAKSDAAGSGRSPDTPLATLDYAVGLCTAGQGDTIVLMPGHAESKTTTGDIATLDVAGIRVIGLGNGLNRPTFTLGHAGTTLTVSAANVLLRNVRLVSDVADCAVGLTASATADGLTVERCQFASGALTKELKIGVSIAAACTDVTIQGCQFDTIITDETGSETNAILCAGAADRLRVLDCEMIGNFGTAAIAAATAASVRIVIARNLIYNIDSTNGLCVSLHASTNGIVSDNRLTGLKTNTVPLACAGCAAHENYTSAAVNESGIVRPAAETYA